MLGLGHRKAPACLGKCAFSAYFSQHPPPQFCAACPGDVITRPRANARPDRDRRWHLRSRLNCARLCQSKSKRLYIARIGPRVGHAVTQKPQALAQFSFTKTGPGSDWVALRAHAGSLPARALHLLHAGYGGGCRRGRVSSTAASAPLKVLVHSFYLSGHCGLVGLDLQEPNQFQFAVRQRICHLMITCMNRADHDKGNPCTYLGVNPALRSRRKLQGGRASICHLT